MQKESDVVNWYSVYKSNLRDSTTQLTDQTAENADRVDELTRYHLNHFDHWYREGICYFIPSCSGLNRAIS
ncbi:Uncharacterized protein HZ326_14187 [Fusarium oxysporum f. sp. albedinis]|nr:Uncharacterized protein HZ326_14187 [Fusarium oxysporum f. sp. albedinis]